MSRDARPRQATCSSSTRWLGYKVLPIGAGVPPRDTHPDGVASQRTARVSKPLADDPKTHVSGPELAMRRVLLLAAAGAAVVAVLAGLGRLGVVSGWCGSHAAAHGPLFVLGALAVVIQVERAAFLGHRWGYAAPVLGTCVTVTVLANLPGAPAFAIASALALVAVNASIVRGRPTAFAWLMLVGSGVLLVGAIAWALDRPVYQLVSAWMAFLVLTIVAERVEISRLGPMPRRTVLWVAGIIATFAASACAAAFGVSYALRGFGAAAILVGVWQVRFDMARRTLDRPGLSRFAAVGVLLGTSWLILSGVLFATTAVPPAGPLYDAALHAVFVGYVLSMVFSHAPFILPIVARASVPFSPWLYVPLLVLHVGLLARVVGDLASRSDLRQAGGVANAAALVLFVLFVLVAALMRRAKPVPA